MKPLSLSLSRSLSLLFSATVVHFFIFLKIFVQPRFQCQQLSIFGAAFFQAQSRVKVELTKIASFENYLLYVRDRQKLELKKDAVQHPER